MNSCTIGIVPNFNFAFLHKGSVVEQVFMFYILYASTNIILGWDVGCS